MEGNKELKGVLKGGKQGPEEGQEGGREGVLEATRMRREENITGKKETGEGKGTGKTKCANEENYKMGKGRKTSSSV